MKLTNGSFTLHLNSTHIGYSITGSGEPLLVCPAPWGVDGHRWKTLDELAMMERSGNFPLVKEFLNK